MSASPTPAAGASADTGLDRELMLIASVVVLGAIMSILDVTVAAITFGLVFLAELADTSALVTLVLASRFSARWVLLGVFAGMVVHVAVALAAGSLLALLPFRFLEVVLVLTFLVGAFLIYREGEEVRFPELADTLEEVGEQGPGLFYEGRLGRLVSEYVLSMGGILTPDDLAGYEAVVRQERLGRGLQALVHVTLRAGARATIPDFAERVRALPEVSQLFFLGGNDDFIVHVAVPDSSGLRRFVVDHLSADATVAVSWRTAW